MAEGVYRFAAAPEGWWSDLIVNLLRTPRRGAVSHSASLRLLGLPSLLVPYTPEITVLGSAPLEGASCTVHRTRNLDACDLTLVGGIPCTNGARTAIDLAPRLGRLGITRLVDDLVTGGFAGQSWLHRRATALCNGRAGVGVIVRVTAPDANVAFRSWLERLARGLLLRHGLPVGCWNVELSDCPDAGVVDTLLPGRIVVEWDGLRFHSGPEARQRDDAKGNALTLAGYRLLRFTWEDVVERPAEVVAQIRHAMTG